MLDNGRMTNHTPIHNGIKRVFFAQDSELDYGDFAVFVYIAMYVQNSAGNGKSAEPNGKQGYAYPTKTRMMGELGMSKTKLNRCIDRLVAHGFIEAREVANKYGGKPLLEYRVIDRWKSRL